MKLYSAIGKTLDQPLLISKFSRAVPAVLTTGAAAYGLKNVLKAPKDERKEALIKNTCVLSTTVASALLCAKALKPNKIKSVVETIRQQSDLIDKFVKENPVKDEVSGLLNKMKTKVLNIKEIKTLGEDLSKTEKGKKFLRELIPDPEYVKAKDIFGEIGRLSVMGFVPVVAGISGGILGDKLKDKNWKEKVPDNWKEKVPDKIKEGFYQFFANIFLCNVGAGAALGIMEKAGVTSKSKKAAGMIAGIALTGIIGGSAIANYLGEKLINPLFGRKIANNDNKNLYSERKPEALDVGLHVDDVATVAVISGLSWIEPALPILYSISGYRAGIGYRNGKEAEIKTETKMPNAFQGNTMINSEVFKQFLC